MQVTFITAVYNAVSGGRDEVLARCVRSVAACAVTHEHLIIDGGSQDGTVQLLQQLTGECHNMRFISECDSGIYNALNKGVKMACGEWVHILGCDDWICSPEELDAVLRDPAAKKVDMLVTPVEREDNLRTINLKACLYSIPFCHQGLLMRTESLCRLGGFDEEFKLAADYALTLKAFLANTPMAVITHKFCHYTLGGASSAWDKLRADDARVAQKYLGLTDGEKMHFESTKGLPLRVVLKTLCHANAHVRSSARFSVFRWLFLKCRG